MRTSRRSALALLLAFSVGSGAVIGQTQPSKSTRRTAAPPAASSAAPAKRPAGQAAASGATSAKKPGVAAPATKPNGTALNKPNASAAAKQAPGKGVAAAQATPPAAPIPPEVLYTVPKKNDVTELSAFLGRLLDYQPRTDEEMAVYQKRAPEAMNQAATRILQLEKDKTSAPYRFAMNYVLAMKLMEFDKATAQDRQLMYDYLLTSLGQPTLDPDVLDLAVAFAENLEFLGDVKGASQAYAAFAAKIAKNADPLVAELAGSLNASARRLNLVGQAMQISGKTVDGAPFQWAKYRGKVVIVDFWATWCGPCVADMPKLKQHYDTYRKSGLEIVGISLDQDPAQLKAFLQKNQLPWVTLHEGDDSINPTAKYYGISALPTTIVVDQQGKVVSLNARGEQLDKILGTLLGQAKLPDAKGTDKR